MTWIFRRSCATAAGKRQGKAPEQRAKLEASVLQPRMFLQLYVSAIESITGLQPYDNSLLVCRTVVGAVSS